MNKFLAKNKVNLEKMFLVIFLYIYMITFLAYILTDHFYSYGFNIGVLYSALLFAFAWWICGFRRNFLIAYLGMMFFLCSGILIKLFDHIIVMALDIFVNISLASIIWISILLIGFCINNIAAILGKCSVGRVIAGLWIIFSLIPFALSNLLFWIYYIVSHHYLRSDIILAVYQTNLKEAIDYLLTQNIFSLLFAFLGSLLILIFIGYVVRIICISMRKRIEFASRRYLWGSLILTIFLLLLGVKVTYSFVGYEPVRIMDSLKNSVKRYTSFAKNRQERMQYLYNLGTLSVLPEHKGIYVLVIGESTARDHMSVYGYRFDTTPWMSQFVKEPGTICFKKAYSNYVTTVPVLTYALTDKNQYNSVSMAQAYSLIEVAAFHDSLTELPNRLYMESILKVRFYEYHKLFRPFAVMFMDIDHFHDFNIKYGHVAGDMMLKSFADSIKENVRHEDVIGRWGGEEFVGVCPVPYEKDAVPIANRLRDVVNQAYIIKDGNKLSVTVSIGVTFVREEDTLKSIVDRADRLLFKAKQAGRDRIMIDADVPLVGKIERADIR